MKYIYKKIGANTTNSFDVDAGYYICCYSDSYINSVSSVSNYIGANDYTQIASGIGKYFSDKNTSQNQKKYIIENGNLDAYVTIGVAESMPMIKDTFYQSRGGTFAFIETYTNYNLSPVEFATQVLTLQSNVVGVTTNVVLPSFNALYGSIITYPIVANINIGLKLVFINKGSELVNVVQSADGSHVVVGSGTVIPTSGGSYSTACFMCFRASLGSITTYRIS